MIIFHEGMPRSGKSYAALVDHIIPALKSGRTVYARLDGLNYEQIAELSDIDEVWCHELLLPLSEDDIPKLDQISLEKDALVVIDELQNYFPAHRQPLNQGMTIFVAEHGHHGLDVLCMGQVLKDCHKTWIQRTNRKIQFVKKDMLGKPDEYKWTMYTGSLDARGNVKFTEVTKGDGTYDPKYFGCYASHTPGTANKGTYVDERANIWRSPIFRKWLPMFGILVLAAIAYLVYLFNGGLSKSVDAPKVAKTPPGPAPVTVTETITSNVGTPVEATRTLVDGKEVKPVTTAVKQESKTDPFEVPDLLTDLAKDNRIRLGGVIRTATRTRVIIEFRDASQRVVERVTDDELSVLGWNVMTNNTNNVAVLYRPDRRMVATAWPLEEDKGKVPDESETRIRNASPAVHERGYRPAALAQADPEVSFRHIGGDRPDPYSPTR